MANSIIAPDTKDWTRVPRAKRDEEVCLPSPLYEKYRGPALYDPDPGLIAAVNTAMFLGQPLLLTGEPGSGKTSFADWLAWQLGLEHPIKQVVKSSTRGSDLLYSFDDLARFRDAQARQRRPLRDYVSFNALGQAILFSAGPDQPCEIETAVEAEVDMPRTHADLWRDPFPSRRRQVVLIDELDKAPRDTPNDLLVEIEEMAFRIPELGVRVRGDRDNRPLVVITNNSEKSLPEPFLRRCVYYDIPAPDADRRREIIQLRNAPFGQRGSLLDEALGLFEGLAQKIGRRPGTGELLAWLEVMEAACQERERRGMSVASLRGETTLLEGTLGTLAKTQDDLRRARAEIDAWTKSVGAPYQPG